MAWRPLRNLGLKFAALGLGTLLWFTVSGQQVERTVNAPILHSHVPPSLEITGDLTVNVLVHLRGSDSQISRIAPGDVRAMIDLADAHAMSRGILTLRTDQIMVPFGVEVMRVDPPDVMLTLERTASKMVPVIPEIAGKPAAGFSVGKVTVEPAQVEVIGPESQLERLDHATTVRMQIEHAAATVTQNVNITVPDAALRLREPRLAKVTVAIVLTKDIKK